MVKTTIPREEYMMSGHVACQGCGAAIAMRYVLKALGPKTLMSIPACCWAVIPGVWPQHNLKVPLLYTAFEVTGAALSGMEAALIAKGEDKDTVVLGFAGDGGTADIGLQSLSGMAERGTNAIYVMYDNEAYMNTGIQRSGSTPYGAWTTTTPVGKKHEWKTEYKKSVAEIMVAHDIPYVATATIAYPEDLIAKMKKAKSMKGPKFIQIFSPCPTGWKHPPEISVEVSRKAVQSRMFPLYEVEYGKYRITQKPKQIPVKDYLRLQGRFKYLPDEEIEKMQRHVDRRWELLLKKEEFTQANL